MVYPVPMKNIGVLLRVCASVKTDIFVICKIAWDTSTELPKTKDRYIEAFLHSPSTE